MPMMTAIKKMMKRRMMMIMMMIMMIMMMIMMMIVLMLMMMLMVMMLLMMTQTHNHTAEPKDEAVEGEVLYGVAYVDQSQPDSGHPHHLHLHVVEDADH